MGYASVDRWKQNNIFWVWNLLDVWYNRNTKEAQMRCILKDRTKNRLLPIVKKYVYTCENENEDRDIIMNVVLRQ